MEGNVRVVDRVFDILEVLSHSSDAMPLALIAEKTGMSKSTVHRLLSTMCARQYVEKMGDGYDIIYVKCLGSYPNTRLYIKIGYRSPAYCSSMEKVLLACLSGDELDEALYHCPFTHFTSNTITDIHEFKRYLKVIRKQGWAMDNEEYQLGHRWCTYF